MAAAVVFTFASRPRGGRHMAHPVDVQEFDELPFR